MDKPEGFFPDRELLAYRRSLLPRPMLSVVNASFRGSQPTLRPRRTQDEPR